jgi:cardiolipin synthase (CMP-forming)
MALSPVVGYLIVTGDFPAAAGTLAFSAFLDWADGWVARTWDQGSLLGSFLDPLSDKALVACTGAALGWIGVLPLPLLALVIGRDVALVGGAFYFRAVTRRPGEAFFGLSSVDWKVEPSTLSKANTVLQLVTVLAGVGHAGWGLPPADVLTGLCWATAGTTFASGWGYWRNAGVTVRAAAAAAAAAGGGGGGGPVPPTAAAGAPSDRVAEFRRHAKDVQGALFGRLLGRVPPSQPPASDGGGGTVTLPPTSAPAAAPSQGSAGTPAPTAAAGQSVLAPAAPSGER